MEPARDTYIERCRNYMNENKSTVISVRLPVDIAQWFNERGGSSIIKNVLYAYIMVQTCGVGSGKKGQLLRTIIEESVDQQVNTLDVTSVDIPPSLKFE